MSFRDDPTCVVGVTWDEEQMVYRVAYRNDNDQWVEAPGLGTNVYEVTNMASTALYQVAG